MYPLICSALLLDTGIPLITLNLFAIILLLIPVIIVEALFYKKWLKLATGPAFKSSALSNIISTIAGYAIVIAIAFLIGLGVNGFRMSPIANLMLWLNGSTWMQVANAHFLIPVVCLLTFLPFFLVSYLIEYVVVRAMLRRSLPTVSGITVHRLRRAVRNANLVTYLAMFIIVSVYLTLLASASRPLH
jgi:hypothetical protein